MKSFARPFTLRALVPVLIAGAVLASAQIVLAAPPTGDFSFVPAVPQPGDPVSFSATAEDDDAPVVITWDFEDDGLPDSAGDSPTHTYDTAGTRTVRMTLTAGTDVTEVTKVIRVNATPTADFSFTPVAPQPGGTVTFRATATDDAALRADAYAWDTDGDAIVDFNDGDTAEVTRSYPTPGTRMVRLRVTDSDDTTAIVTKVVTVNARPLADFTVTPGTPRLREPMKFTSTSRDPDTATAADPDGNLTYAWDLDQDGAYDDSTAAAPTLPTGYATPGIKRVRLRVTDNTGATSDKERAFEVQEVAPIGSFTFSPANPLPGQVVTFRSTSVPSPGAKITSLEWDFDGNSVIDATGAVVTHEFQTAGPRTVSLKVTEDSGGYDAHSAVVTVNAPPIAAIRFAPPSPYVGDAVDFASLSRDPDGYLASEAWDTDGDGAFDDATGKVAARSFRTAGAHIVRLRVVDGLGAAAVQSVTVNVVRRPPPPKPELDVIEPGIRLSLVPGTTRIRRLHVRAPKGAKIKISCKGRGCPRRKASSTRSRGKLVRVRWLERRLRAGTKIVVAVTQKGKIGSHTTLVIRRSGAPRRVRCLMPGSAKPERCPA